MTACSFLLYWCSFLFLGNLVHAALTPLPQAERPSFSLELCQEALDSQHTSLGAKLINREPIPPHSFMALQREFLALNDAAMDGLGQALEVLEKMGGASRYRSLRLLSDFDRSLSIVFQLIEKMEKWYDVVGPTRITDKFYTDGLRDSFKELKAKIIFNKEQLRMSIRMGEQLSSDLSQGSALSSSVQKVIKNLQKLIAGDSRPNGEIGRKIRTIEEWIRLLHGRVERGFSRVFSDNIRVLTHNTAKKLNIEISGDENWKQVDENASLESPWRLVEAILVDYFSLRNSFVESVRSSGFSSAYLTDQGFVGQQSLGSHSAVLTLDFLDDGTFLINWALNEADAKNIRPLYIREYLSSFGFSDRSTYMRSGGVIRAGK